VSDEIHWGIMIFNGILIKMSRLKRSPTDVCAFPNLRKTIYFLDVEEINCSEFVYSCRWNLERHCSTKSLLCVQADEKNVIRKS